MSLQSFVNEYELEYKDFKFWTPYAINQPGFPEGPYRGKGQPAEIKSALAKILEVYPDPLKSGEEIRYVMLRNNLGVDCSGFVYYVLDSHLQTKNLRLADQILIPKQVVVDSYQKESWQKAGAMTKAEVGQLPDPVPLGQICDRTQKKPQDITNVARLVDEQWTIKVDPADVVASDMIYLSGEYGDHIRIVANREADRLTIAESTFDVVGVGGIKITELTTSEFTRNCSSDKDFVKVCRLKVLHNG